MPPKKKCKNPTQRILNGMKRRRCMVCGEPLRSWGMEREIVDVTMSGMFGGKPDYERKFIPGLVSLVFECTNGHTWEEPFPTT